MDGVTVIGASVVDLEPKKFRIPLKKPFFVVVSGATVVVEDVVGGGRWWMATPSGYDRD